MKNKDEEKEQICQRARQIVLVSKFYWCGDRGALVELTKARLLHGAFGGIMSPQLFVGGKPSEYVSQYDEHCVHTF
jgi:hypothetical protein